MAVAGLRAIIIVAITCFGFQAQIFNGLGVYDSRIGVL